MIERLFTIGVYGKSEEEFFSDLSKANVQTFCDIRRRRGVRGSQYSFVNSSRLQEKLSGRNVHYRHILKLAPTEEVREFQRTADEQSGISKRNREVLSNSFIKAYEHLILRDFDSYQFANSFQPEVGRIALFCVEASPLACHRSLVADRLATDLNITVEHL